MPLLFNLKQFLYKLDTSVVLYVKKKENIFFGDMKKMMTKEHFKTLLEAQSLNNYIYNCDKRIEDQHGRVKTIETKRQEKAQEMKNKENEYQEIKTHLS